MGKKKGHKLPRTYTPGRIFQEGVAPDGFDEAGHVLVVTDHGLAMLIAGLRIIRHDSPEVELLLETLETQLRDSVAATEQETKRYG